MAPGPADREGWAWYGRALGYSQHYYVPGDDGSYRSLCGLMRGLPPSILQWRTKRSEAHCCWSCKKLYDKRWRRMAYQRRWRAGKEA